MYPPQAGTDEQGNVFIPFISSNVEVPFEHWTRTTKKIFQAEGPISIESVILTNKGEVFIQYTEKVNDVNEYPQDGAVTEMDVRSAYPESLVTKDEKRSYE